MLLQDPLTFTFIKKRHLQAICYYMLSGSRTLSTTVEEKQALLLWKDCYSRRFKLPAWIWSPMEAIRLPPTIEIIQKGPKIINYLFRGYTKFSIKTNQSGCKILIFQSSKISRIRYHYSDVGFTAPLHFMVLTIICKFSIYTVIKLYVNT